ncbi:hypothetical protein PAXRUDRAFT_130251 [Paxillus rubicundulus Ve08.2h10]|uniref:ATP-dependent DNA helicase n=1 Tax=Paxillus rubicundulus Ve08.2h10 TaxID=930991 RepID=A0A0D0DN36_9AGAM|nr:hypothetical protein PAXRUDRAFT_130251 [Paxillus rubicundulus Ve08.2h10]
MNSTRHALQYHVLRRRNEGGEYVDGNIVMIPRMGLDVNREDYAIGLRRLQFPVHVGYAMTINKAQGQSSIKHVGLDLCSPVFTHDQFYVAISQVTSVHHTKAIWQDTSDQPITKNIVYPEVLLQVD